MSRVINPDSIGKERTRLTKSVVLALRELMRQSEPDQASRDLAAYIALALAEIHATVDVSVAAWEKRGYWVKADRFRMDWEWTQFSAQKMREAVLKEDWPAIAMTAVQVGQKMMNVDVPARHHLGTPWVGAWNQLKETH